MTDIKNPYFEFGDEKAGVPGNLTDKLFRYAKAHQRALYMSNYILSHQEHPIFDGKKISFALKKCGDWLVFRDYYEKGEIRLHSADFCKKHLLCPLCAIRRGAKYLRAYMEKYLIVMSENPHLRPYFVTLTVKNGDSLTERFKHLKDALSKMVQARRDYLKRGGVFTEFCKSDAGVYSIEFKRGENSKQWHPHVHMIWLCEDKPDANALSREWHGYTGDSFIVDVRELYGELVGSFCEVFKYALKFSGLSLEDNFHAFEVLSAKKLLNSFGLLRGVKVPEDLTDEALEDEPYIEFMFKYCEGIYENYSPLNRCKSELG